MQIPLWVDSSAARGEVVKNKITYLSTPNLILNNSADDLQNTYDVEDVSIQPTWDEMVEPHPDRDGSSAGFPRELQKILIIRGWIRGTSQALVNDKVNAMLRAFNPVLNYLDDSSDIDRGFTALKFNVPTTDTTNWPSGLIAVQYYVRPIQSPIPVVTRFGDLNARFNIVLRAVDPRCYEQTGQTANRTGSGTITCNNSLATYPSYPIVTVAITTAPTADFTIYNGTDSNVFLSFNHSNVNASKTYTIDCQAKTVVDELGADATSILKSNSQFFTIAHAASNTIHASSNTPSNAVITVQWTRAFS